MKGIIEFITGMLTGPTGDISSKRLWASVLFIAGIVYIFALKAPSDNIIYCVFGTATVLLGVGALTKS